jgi:hypothetical protein
MSANNARYLVTVAAIGIVSFSSQASAGGLNVGGLVGGTLGALGGSQYGATGGVSAKANATLGKTGLDAKAKWSISNINAKVKVVLYKKRFHASAKLLVGKNGTYGKQSNIVKVTAVVGAKPVNAKAKVLIGANKEAKVFASLNGKNNVTGKLALADVGAGAKIGLNFGSNNAEESNGMSPTGSALATGKSTPGAMALTFRDLSMQDQMILTNRCSTVLTVPGHFDGDMVALCRIIAAL